MSHVAEVKTVFKSLDDIEAAAKRLGGNLVRDQPKYRMYASGFVDDSTTWRTMFSDAEADRIAGLPRHDRIAIVNKALSHADHVITFPGARYDVGVVKHHDGTWRLRWDSYSAGGLVPFMGDRKGGRFAQAYAVAAAKRAARVRGYSARETTRADGHIELELLVR